MRAGTALFAILLLAAFASGCAQVPQEEVDAAEAAYTLAQKAGGEVYADAAMREMEGIKKELDEELTLQANNSGFSKSYVKTTELSEKLRSTSEFVVKEVQKGKLRVKEEYGLLLPEVEDTMTAAEETVTGIRKRDRKKLGYDERMEFVEACKLRMNEAQSQFTDGKFWEARAKLQEVKKVAKAVAANTLEEIPADFVPPEVPVDIEAEPVAE